MCSSDLAGVRRNHKMTELLLSHGADPNQVEAGTPPPLIIAMDSDQHRTAELLIEGGTDLNSKYKGKTLNDIRKYPAYAHMMYLFKDNGSTLFA